MKVGDLVTVVPARETTYLVVSACPRKDDNYLGKCWMLYNVDIGVQLMHEKWMEYIPGDTLE